MTYVVIAQRINTRDGWTSSVGVPAFEIEAWSQAGAERKAREILGDADDEISLSVGEV